MANNKSRKGKKPQNRRGKATSRSTTINNRLEISQVVGTGAFQLQYFNTLVSNIPWLSTIAAGYSRYKYVRASVEFVPHIGTQSSGQVAMAFSYDEIDTPPAGMLQIGQTNGSITRPLYGTGKRIICHADTRKQLPSYRFCSADHYPTVPPDTRNDYNPFTLWFGTDSQVNGQIIGTLHYSFSVLLLDPIFLEANSHQEQVPDVTPTPIQPLRINIDTDDEKELRHATMHASFCRRQPCKYHDSFTRNR